MTKATEGRIPLEDLLVFHQVARSLTSSFDLETILRTIMEHMERFIEADLWTLLMLDEDRGRSFTTPLPRAEKRLPCATCA
jgi:GAF domain-containing protein